MAKFAGFACLLRNKVQLRSLLDSYASNDSKLHMSPLATDDVLFYFDFQMIFWENRVDLRLLRSLFLFRKKNEFKI